MCEWDRPEVDRRAASRLSGVPRDSSVFTTANLVRAGFQDGDAARDLLSALGPAAGALVALLARTADPDLGLSALVRLREAASDPDELLSTLEEDEGTAMRLLSVLGMSAALGDHLVRHPDHWHELTDPTLGSTRPAAYAVRAGLLEAVGADPEADDPVAGLSHEEAVDALRVEYRRMLLRLASRDLAHDVAVDDVAAELADLAAGDARRRPGRRPGRIGPDAASCRLAVVAMGKCGGHELNYVSDVDVIFVAEPAATGQPSWTRCGSATQLAATLMQVCSDHTAEGTIWPVDADLRPEGKAGPLVRTARQPSRLLRAVGEDLGVPGAAQGTAGGRGPRARAGVRRDRRPAGLARRRAEGFVEDVQAMRRRVLEHIPANEADRQLKLGSGGLRDVEFAVQLMQLVHGRTDETVRSPTTLSALARLTEGGYVGREDGESLHDAYAFLRTLEHRIQLYQLRRTHVVPDDVAALRRLGRSLGFRRRPVEELEQAWNHHRVEARRLHEKLFYRPLLAAVARIPGDGARLTPEAAKAAPRRARICRPEAALRHLEALTAGVTRTAAIQRTLLPVLLEWFADAPDPDAGLFGFRRISDALGSTPWYLKLLRDEGETAQRLAQVLATSRYATDLLEREPEGVQDPRSGALRPLGRDGDPGGDARQRCAS